MFYRKNEEVLQHHGILGQKWGIRRFQNKDGTRTAASKKRSQENAEDSSEKKKVNIDKKTLIKGAAIAGTVAVSAAAIANPTTRNLLVKYGKTTLSNLKDVDKAKAIGTKIGTKVGEGAAEAQKAAFKSVMASVSGIAISKISNSLKTNENASEAEKTKNKIVRDAVIAGVQAATKTKGNNLNNNNANANLKPDVKEKVGEPSNKEVDKQSSKWQSLFIDSNGDQRDSEAKNTIRAMAKAGYDIDQIDEYLNHSALKEWADSFVNRR